VALKQMRESPVPPHEIDPTVPVPIERAILKCLEKEPGKRFQSIAELENALRAPGAPAPPQPAVNFALNHSSHAPASHVPFAQAEPQRRSAVPWVLLLALLIVGAYAGWHFWQIDQVIEFTPPPTVGHLPAPPDFALGTDTESDSPASPTGLASVAPAAPAKSESDKTADAATAPAESAPVPSKSADATPVSATGSSAPPKTQAPVTAAAPRAAQRRARSFGEDEPVDQRPVNDHTPSYLWIGRFEREDKAQSIAKKIEDLGLPVTVVPRRGLTGEFYIVVTGPYGPERVESAMDYLKTQGFANVRLIKNPGGQQNPNN
jgi:hypothetical protein